MNATNCVQKLRTKQNIKLNKNLLKTGSLECGKEMILKKITFSRLKQDLKSKKRAFVVTSNQNHRIIPI